MPESQAGIHGMRAFLVIWAGQVVSLFGTGMTRFAVTLWVWEKTGEATALALAGFFGFVPGIILSPIAGALVDRWNRKLAMMVSDLMAALSTCALLSIILLAGIGKLELWHLYAAVAVASAGEAFQFPAYSAAISTMIKPTQYARASGLQSIAETASGIFSPVLGGVLYVAIGLQGLLFIDIATFLIAIGALLIVHIPQPARTEAGAESRSGGFRAEVLYGFKYIKDRPSLLGLQLIFFGINLTGSFVFTILPALILARTEMSLVPIHSSSLPAVVTVGLSDGVLLTGDKVLLGAIFAAGSIGGLIGGLFLSAWGGPKKRVHGVLMGMFGGSLFGTMVIGLGQVSIMWAFGAFFESFFIPILNGSNQAIWQAKVAPDVQGRVFAVRRLIAQISVPLAMLLSGPSADLIFGPAMQPDGALSGVFGWLVGTGPGAGISLMFVIAGILGMMIAAAGYLVPAIRDAETLLPDHAVAAATD
ncbi:MAG: macrolide transporter [Chloroflexota bacterium]|nr:MAG: macrolide transporter [Chloroflexota bacterium]